MSSIPVPQGDVASTILFQPVTGAVAFQPTTLDRPSALSFGSTPAAFVFSTHGGAPGVDGEIPARRYERSGDYLYTGSAPVGSAEGDAVWTINRLTYASGTYVSTTTATAVTWTGRADHTYS